MEAEGGNVPREQTLLICKSVDVFGPIPPRTGRGYASGEWLVENKIATTRLRVLAIGNDLEVRLEDSETGETFGACPVPRGQRDAAVENAIDSSRNFVLRILDPGSGRKAFLGINFAERSNAFDFNVALTDFEKQMQREEDLKMAQSVAASPHSQLPSSSSAAAAASETLPDAASMYQKHDFSLKQGENIKVEVKKSTGSAGGGGFLSRLGGGGSSSTSAASGGGGGLIKLAPPLSVGVISPSPPPPSTAAAAAPGGGVAEAKVVASSEEGWATF